MNLTTDTAPHDESNARRVLLVTCMAAFMAFIDLTIVNTAFPDIARSFPESSLGSLSWVVNAYTILFAALLLPAGRIADLVGRKRVFIVGIAVFTLASAAAAAAPTLNWLIAARIVQGASAALMVPTSMALLLPAFPRERQPVAIGLWGATNSLAAAIGPALGGALVELVDWRLVFLVNIPVGILAVVAAQRVLTEQRSENAKPPGPRRHCGARNRHRACRSSDRAGQRLGLGFGGNDHLRRSRRRARRRGVPALTHPRASGDRDLAVARARDVCRQPRIAALRRHVLLVHPRWHAVPDDGLALQRLRSRPRDHPGCPLVRSRGAVRGRARQPRRRNAG